jgi:microcystin-dependent protein
MAFEPFLAEIVIYPYTFVPKGWADCDGQLMPISQNTALFALLGTNYGGDGKSTFALPDLQGAAPMHPNYDQIGLAVHPLGEMGGTPFVTLLESEIPAHTHALRASSEDANDDDPANAALASSVGVTMYSAPQNLDTAAFQVLTPAGGSQPHNNMQPYLVLRFCIALQGVFPQRG